MVTIRTKIMAIFISVIVILLLSTMTYHYARKHEEKQFKQVYRENAQYSIQNILLNQERDLIKTTRDYGTWDDMATFVKTRDPEWAQENVASLLKTMDVDYASVLEKDFKPVYSVFDSAKFKSGHPLITSAMVKEAMKGKLFCNFYFLANEGILEIAVSKIVPSWDSEQKSEAKGYVVNGRLWTPSYIKTLEKTSNANLEIIPMNKRSLLLASHDPKEKKYIVIQIMLPDYQRKDIIRIDFISKTQLQLDENFFLYFTLIPIILSLIVSIIFLFAFRSWITLPLSKIAESLDQSDPTPLKNISSRNHEFHSIALMMIDFFDSKNRLEQAIEERKVAEENIQKYTEELKESNLSKDKFFSIIAHDLRSPFHAILGYTEILNNEYDFLEEDERKKFISILRSSTKNVYDLLENLLQWSRLQTGRLTFSPEVFDISLELEETLEVLQANALRKNIEMVNSVPEGTLVNADKYMVRSIFQNLISNALKFTNPYGIVSIAVLRKEKHLEFIIRDTGIGISKEDRKKLFRIDLSFTRKGTAKESGTGLGLILCKELIHKNGGNIWAESEPGRGTVFHFTLAAG